MFSYEFDIWENKNNHYMGGLQMLIMNTGNELGEVVQQREIKKVEPQIQQYEDPAYSPMKKVYSKPLQFDKKKYFEGQTKYDLDLSNLSDDE